MAGNKSLILSILGKNKEAREAIAQVDEDADRLKEKSGEIFVAANTEKAIGPLEELDSALEEYKLKANEAMKAQERLMEIQKDSESSAGQLAAAQKAVTDSARALKDAQLQLGRAELASGDEAKVAAAKQDELAVKIRFAGDEAKVAAGKQEELAAKNKLAGDSAKESGEGIKKFALIAGVALAGTAYESIKLGLSFQSSMTQLVTQAGVAKSALPGLESGVLNLAGKVGFSPNSLSEALFHVESSFASVGIKGPQALHLVSIAAQGATVGHADLVDVTNALDAAVTSGIPGVQNYSQAMGTLNAIVGSGDMKMQDLAEAFGSGMVATVKGFGLSITDVGAALAVFGDNNIRGADAGTQVRMAVMALAKPAATAKAELHSLGLTTTTLRDTMRDHGLLAALTQLREGMKKAGVTATEQGGVITDVFGKKAGAGLNVLMDQFDRLKSKYPDIEKGAKDFGKSSAEAYATPAEKLVLLKSGLEAAGTTLGLVLLPAFTDVLNPLVKFMTWISESKGRTEAFAVVAGALATTVLAAKLSGAVRGVGKDIEALGGLFKAVAVRMGIMTGATEAQTVATEAGTVATEESNAAFLMNPIGIVIIAIVALVAAFYELWKHCAAFRDFWKDAWRDITHYAAVAFDWVKDHWKLILAILVDPIGIAVYEIHRHWSEIVSGAEWMFHTVVNLFVSMPSRILGYVKDFGHLLLSAGKWLIQGLITGIEDQVDSLWNLITNIGNKISGAFKSVMHMFSPSRVFAEHGKNIVLGLVMGINGYSHLGEEAIRSMAQRAIGASGGHFNGVTSSSNAALTIEWVGGAGADAEFIAWLKKQIRIRGGNPAVLGR